MLKPARLFELGFVLLVQLLRIAEQAALQRGFAADQHVVEHLIGAAMLRDLPVFLVFDLSGLGRDPDGRHARQQKRRAQPQPHAAEDRQLGHERHQRLQQADHSIEDQADGVVRLLLKAIHPLAHGLVLQHLGLQPHLLFQNDLLKLRGGDGLNALLEEGRERRRDHVPRQRQHQNAQRPRRRAKLRPAGQGIHNPRQRENAHRRNQTRRDLKQNVEHRGEGILPDDPEDGSELPPECSHGERHAPLTMCFML